MSENDANATPPSSPKTISLTPLLTIPQTPANEEVHAFLEKLKALEKFKRYHNYLLNSTGLQCIDRENALIRYRNQMEFHAKIVMPLTNS